MRLSVILAIATRCFAARAVKSRDFGDFWIDLRAAHKASDVAAASAGRSIGEMAAIDAPPNLPSFTRDAPIVPGSVGLSSFELELLASLKIEVPPILMAATVTREHAALAPLNAAKPGQREKVSSTERSIRSHLRSDISARTSADQGVAHPAVTAAMAPPRVTQRRTEWDFPPVADSPDVAAARITMAASLDTLEGLESEVQQLRAQKSAVLDGDASWSELEEQEEQEELLHSKQKDEEMSSEQQEEEPVEQAQEGHWQKMHELLLHPREKQEGEQEMKEESGRYKGGAGSTNNPAVNNFILTAFFTRVGDSDPARAAHFVMKCVSVYILKRPL